MQGIRDSISGPDIIFLLKYCNFLKNDSCCYLMVINLQSTRHMSLVLIFSKADTILKACVIIKKTSLIHSIIYLLTKVIYDAELQINLMNGFFIFCPSSLIGAAMYIRDNTGNNKAIFKVSKN